MKSKVLTILFIFLIFVILGELIFLFINNKAREERSLINQNKTENQKIAANVKEKSEINLQRQGYLNFLNEIIKKLDSNNADLTLTAKGILKEFKNLGNDYCSFRIENKNGEKIVGFLSHKNSKVIKIFEDKDKVFDWKDICSSKKSENYKEKEVNFTIKYNMNEQGMKLSEVFIYL